MIVSGRNLFPLSLIGDASTSYSGYYMDAAGAVYSTRTANQLRKLKGMIPKEDANKPDVESYRVYTIGGKNKLGSFLYKMAKSHSTFVSSTTEIRDAVRDAASTFAEALGLKPLPKHVMSYPVHTTVRIPPSKTRDVTMGVEQRGSIIGQVSSSGVLTFSSSPIIHLTPESLREEMERLATVNPGVTFVAARLSGSVRSGGVTWK